jgi:hypothetical protein
MTSRVSTRPGRRARAGRTEALVLVAVVAFLVPSLADLCSPSWRRRVFGWVAADGFYYLTVARNFARYGRVAYDQTNPSNGFHPLWQALCAIVAVILRCFRSEDRLALAVVLLGVGLTTASIPLLGRFLSASGARLSILFPLLPVGIYALLILPVWMRGMPSMANQNPYEGPMPLYGTLFSDANGMESALVLLFFALSARTFAVGDPRGRGRDARTFGLALAGVVLSRLDHALLVLPLVCGVATSSLATLGWRGPALSLLGAFSLPIVLYLVINHHFYGVLMPVSGALKSSFPHVNNQNIDDIREFWTRPWRDTFLTRAYRHFAAELPAASALLYLVVVVDVKPHDGAILVRMRPWTGRHDVFLALAALGVLLLGAYDIFFVGWFAQGHWYFPVSTLFVSLAVFSVAAPLERRISCAWRKRGAGRSVRTAFAAWLAVCAASVVIVFVLFHRQLGYHRNYADFYFVEAPKLCARYGSTMPKFIEGDDGIIAYSLGAPTMSTGMGLDPAGAAAMLGGDLLGLALTRGYDRLTSLVYTLGDALGRDPSPADLRAWAHSVTSFDDSKGYDFALDYRSANGHFAVVRAWRKPLR